MWGRCFGFANHIQWYHYLVTKWFMKYNYPKTGILVRIKLGNQNTHVAVFWRPSKFVKLILTTPKWWNYAYHMYWICLSQYQHLDTISMHWASIAASVLFTYYGWQKNLNVLVKLSGKHTKNHNMRVVNFITITSDSLIENLQNPCHSVDMQKILFYSYSIILLI